jgi:hypothetical protein
MEEVKTDFVKIQSILNRKDDQLPFGYYCPEMDGKLTWNCGFDPQNQIVSVFCMTENGTRDKKVAILPSMKEALFARDELIKTGWLPLKAPEITMKFPDGSSKPLSRKQKRYLQKQINTMAKHDPFEEEEK